ncbi:MAG: PIG-L family deacetylase [Gemmatimonadales bacterium]|nr:PIG-L family deacetylase [Gemmatimonadales bacterium]
MFRCRLSVASAVLLSFLASPLSAQLEPPSTGGIVALDRQLRMLGQYKRVLMIGAHPDDEDTELLTVLVRGMGAEAAYLSLNRGEGGQNLIGPELGEALGIIRTEELLAARRLDGARQYFTRAYDFGFSKTVEETWRHWPRDTILKDVVRIVRKFRPQVIVSVFSGTPRDGHGQHQAAGWAAAEAFRAAGDGSRFPELLDQEHLEPWTALKLYRSTRFDSAATTVTLGGGVLDSAVGQTYHQIAMAGRSLHRSQDMGQLQQIGPSRVRLALVEDRTARGGAGLFAGVDTTLAAMAGGLGSAAEWGRVAGRMWALRTDPRPAGQVRELFLAALPHQSAGNVSAVTINQDLAEQLARLDSVIVHTSGVLCDALAGDERVIPGQRVRLTLSCWNAGGATRQVEAATRFGGAVEEIASTTMSLAPGELRAVELDVLIPDSMPYTVPYYLRSPRRGDIYRWPDAAELAGEPREPPVLEVVLRSAGAVASVREVTFRRNDQALGEVRRPLTVVPRVDIKLDPMTEVWSTTSSRPRPLTVTLTHGARDTTAGTVTLELPSGWPAARPQPYRLTREDERETLTFAVRAPDRLAPGVIEIRAVTRVRQGRQQQVGLSRVDYPHIRPRAYARPAVSTGSAAPLSLPRLARVGYVRGAADQVPEALRRAGVPLELLAGGALERGDLSLYDAIVIGPRAYEVDSMVVESNARLLDYTRRGGLLIVQYQQHPFFEGGYAPFPLTVGGPVVPPASRPVSHDRVTDESAPVRIVTPVHPSVLGPNRLGDADWSGWVQERGLYFARSWDPAYRPVLETHDPGEAPLRGGLLVAPLGRGTYVYTGLSFFRQLPAGVPGAFRLFANLLALGGPGPGR